jgi:hypothetical protein
MMVSSGGKIMGDAEECGAEEPRKRGRGNPNLRKGGPSLNPSGKRKPDQSRPGGFETSEALEAAQAEIAALRAVLEQREEKSARAENRELRAKVAELESALAEREKAAAPVVDAGSERVLAKIERLFREHGVQPK